MATLRYPVSTLYADYLRVAFGLALTAGPLLLLDLARVVAALLAAFGLLFAWFGVRTMVRHLSRVELSAEAVALRGPIERRLPWSQLQRLKLGYYAPRRARQDGWLQLSLRGATGPTIRVESTLDGFDQLLRRARQAARAKDLALDPATEANLAAFDLDASGGADG
jgi:hypothetical protein